MKCTPQWDASRWQLCLEAYVYQEGVDERLSEFQYNWEAVIAEWSQRWGKNVKGWWFDGCYHADKTYRHDDTPNFKSFADAARSGNSNSIVALQTYLKIISLKIYYDNTRYNDMHKNITAPLRPIKYPGMNVIADKEGIQAQGYKFNIVDSKVNTSRVSWIYANQEKSSGSHDLVLFRKTLELQDQPQRVIAHISADVCFRLYVNGTMVARGPDDIGCDFPWNDQDRYSISTRQWLYVTRDLTSYFHDGVNVIAAEVISYKRAGAYMTAGKPGFWFDAQIACADGSKTTLRSDASWSSLVGEYLICSGSTAGHASMKFNVTAAMTYIAEKEPIGWLEESYIDAHWHKATEIESIWEPMAQSEIPPCMEVSYPIQEIVDVTSTIKIPQDFGKGQAIRINGNGSFILKVDRVIPAYLGLKINGCAGAALTFSWEELKGNSNHAVACVLRDGEQSFEFPGYGSCTYMRIDALNVSSPIEILDIQLVFSSQPVEYKGSFECSDPKLNALWKASRHALQICMQTHHLDSPHHQEPISDPGDYLIEALINFQVFGSPWLIRQDIRKFAKILKTVNYRSFHTSYSLLWIQMLLAYYDYTADCDVVLETAEQVHKLLDTFALWCGKNKLVCNAPNYMFMDWVDIAGFNGHHPPAVIGMGYMSAFYYQALADGIRVAELQNDHDRIDLYCKLRSELFQAFNTVLWDKNAGLYRDGVPFVSDIEPSEPWLPADKDIRTHTAHVNALAVLYDLAPSEKQSEIMHRIMKQEVLNVQPYFMHFVFDALDHAQIFEEYGMRLIKLWEINPETQTFYEMWGRGDLSHAWNGTILYQMSSRILGVTPLKPGFSQVVINPQPCGLDYAKGSIPTPYGPITVEWTSKGKEIDMQINAPEQCKVIINKI